MRRIAWIAILLLSTVHLIATETSSVSVYQGFSGGMMLHTGYQFGQTPAPGIGKWQGATFGIGGALRVHLWKYLRVGGEGFVSTMPSVCSNMRQSLVDGSYVRNGWGGILADFCHRGERVWLYGGGAIGGGSCKSLYIYQGNQNDWEPEASTIYSKQAYMYIDPYVGLDYCMTSKVHLTMRIDWMVALHRGDVVYPTGPRLYFGFMFCH